MKRALMTILLVLVVVPLVGCSSFSSPSASPATSLRQALCERDGGLWHADSENCEMQSPARR
jgi:hypothetical protein